MTLMVKDKNYPRCDQAKLDENDQLVKLGTFEIVPESSIFRNGTVLHSRFLLTIKNHEETFYSWTRCPGGTTSCQSSTHRLQELNSTCSYAFPLWSRAITLAFIQSDENLKRDVYI